MQVQVQTAAGVHLDEVLLDAHALLQPGHLRLQPPDLTSPSTAYDIIAAQALSPMSDFSFCRLASLKISSACSEFVTISEPCGHQLQHDRRRQRTSLRSAEALLTERLCVMCDDALG